MSDDRELTTREAAEYLGWSANAGMINRLVRSGELPARKHGAKAYRIRLADLETLKASHQSDAPTQQTTRQANRQVKPQSNRRVKQAALQAVDGTERLTVDEAAHRLDVTPERVYQLLALGKEQGGIAGERRGGVWEIPTSAVENYLTDRRSAGRPVQTAGEWISQSVAAQLYGEHCGRRVSRQAIYELIKKGRLSVQIINGVRCIARTEVMTLAAKS